ncbi:hypothetical protein KDA08_05630 [Candidatus Saccharibacteria bacterium]|nr:hypothetical protein [Candidatus Saccharibacteria bacterium]
MKHTYQIDIWLSNKSKHTIKMESPIDDPNKFVTNILNMPAIPVKISKLDQQYSYINPQQICEISVIKLS